MPPNGLAMHFFFVFVPLFFRGLTSAGGKKVKQSFRSDTHFESAALKVTPSPRTEFTMFNKHPILAMFAVEII